MATSSTISVVNKDKTISQIYCHWDGDLDNNGKILSENYATLERVQELISLGNLSELDKHIHPTGFNHSFDTPEKNVCVFYGRDRGDSDFEPNKYTSIHGYLNECPFEEFNYMFVDNQWYYSLDDDKLFKVLFPMIVFIDLIKLIGE